MRILYCNKFNYPFSGTEAYLFDLIEKMEKRGHEAALFSMDHGRTPSFPGRNYCIPHIDFKDPGPGFLKKVRMAAHAVYSPSARRAMRSCLAEFSPALAHIRGIYHHLSPSILLGTQAPEDTGGLPPERFQDPVPKLQSCRQRPLL